MARQPTRSATRHESREGTPGDGAPPVGLELERLELEGTELAILSWSLPTLDVATLPGVSPAEADVLRRLVAGAELAEIARARGVSVRTVRNQIASLQKKLGADGRLAILRQLAP